MRLNSLSLRGFRNYEDFSANFVSGMNLIVGDNAQGKTNLLEAMTYLSMGRSFRTRKEQELIGIGADFAELTAQVYSNERLQSLRAVLFAGRRPRQLSIGGVRKKSAGDLSGVLTTVLFCPEDLMTLKMGASSRRRLLDNALCQLRPGYQRAISEYQKLQEHKTRILRERFAMPALLDTLPDFNERMVLVGAIIIAYRARYMEKLCHLTAQYHGEFSGGAEELFMHYQTVSTVHNPLAPTKEVANWLREHQESHYGRELEAGQCLCGPHKDDFDISLSGMSLRGFGSQGQTRTVAIALKLAEREIFRQDTGEEPILLLDDVLSELDSRRQDYILNRIRTGQVFITCCEKDRLTEIGQVITIEKGMIV